MSAIGSAVRVLVADDGVLARQRIEDLLAEMDDVELVASVASGGAAVTALRELTPDIVFIDVQMPDMSGIDVIREIGPDHMPVTVFVTAYDSYALRAFELAAIDYLLKPFADERFAQALARARQQLELRRMNAIAQPLRQLLSGLGAEAASRPYPERLAVEGPGQVQLVPVAEIDYIQASGHYAELHTANKTYLIRERMEQLEERLDPNLFFRIHRSAFVRLDRITSLLRESGGYYSVKLKDNALLSVSRSRVEALEARLGLSPLRRPGDEQSAAASPDRQRDADP